MSVRKVVLLSAATGAAALAAGTAHATVLVDLDPATAAFDVGSTGFVGNSGFSGSTPGVTFNLEFTPTAADLTGTTLLAETGGLSNGFSILLVDGVTTFLSKVNGNNNETVDAIGDTSYAPSGDFALALRNTVAVQGGPALTPGTAASIAVVFDPPDSDASTPDTVTILVDATDDGLINASQDDFTLTGAGGPNYFGNNTLSFGSGGGTDLGGANARNATDEFTLANISDFSGDFTRGLVFTELGAPVANDPIPEPSTAALAVLGGVALLGRRRRG